MKTWHLIAALALLYVVTRKKTATGDVPLGDQHNQMDFDANLQPGGNAIGQRADGSYIYG